jgi:hypothetical protein
MGESEQRNKGTIKGPIKGANWVKGKSTPRRKNGSLSDKQ